MTRVANFCFQLPFLLTLLLLGALIGVVYNMGAIMEFLARFGEAASKFLLIGLGCVLAAGTIFGVVRMVLNYKLRKKNLEYDYKREVMDRLGIAILDERTMIDSRGKMVDSRQIDVTSESPGILPAAAGDDAANETTECR